MSKTEDRYWYHPESDSAFIDNNPSRETEEMCVEWEKHEYDAFIAGQEKQKKPMATLQEIEARYAVLEKNARDTSMGIGQHEQRIDHAIEGLKGAFPNMQFDDPRQIPFDRLVEETQAEIETLTAELDAEFTTLEGKVEEANAHLQHTVESKS